MSGRNLGSGVAAAIFGCGKFNRQGCLLALACVFLMTPAMAQHPHPQPRLTPSVICTSDSTDPICSGTPENTTLIITGEGIFPPGNPFLDPPGTNFLANVNTNMFDGLGLEMPHTLPSTPDVPYNLHAADPVVTEINAASPTDDLFELFRLLEAAAEQKDPETASRLIRLGLDIVEGNPVFEGLELLDEGTPRERFYSDFPLLHYVTPEKVQLVEPILDGNGQVIGGNVNVRQIWYDQRIESDTAMLDPRFVLDVPWTITYTVDVLNRGSDDFSPFVTYTDNPEVSDPFWKANGTPSPGDDAHLPGQRLPHIGMDQTFFPMDDGTRVVFKINMTPGKYFNLIYTWGWRMHPPRIQVIENALKTAAGKTLVEWATDTFGERPRDGEPRSCRLTGDPRAEAIAQIGDLAPAKRIWTALCRAREAVAGGDFASLAERTREAQVAFRAWSNRTRLPCYRHEKAVCLDGVNVDPDSDLTLLYANNTIYGQFADNGIRDFPPWTERGTLLKVTIHNGDYFSHGYVNADFGGSRGWENQFKSTVPIGGSGCWFTFGRAHWWMNNPEPVVVGPAVDASTPTTHRVQVLFNYEPSRRLRFYQFDPFHHDVAIFSIH